MTLAVDCTVVEFRFLCFCYAVHLVLNKNHPSVTKDVVREYKIPSEADVLVSYASNHVLCNNKPSFDYVYFVEMNSILSAVAGSCL